MSEFGARIGVGLAASTLAAFGASACAAEHDPIVDHASNTNAANANISVDNNQPRFDDLGGNSTIIQVYPGTSNSKQDRVHNGTYKDGDRLNAECVTIGRTITSESPERKRKSDVWFRLAGGATIYYASKTYTANTNELAKTLPDC